MAKQLDSKIKSMSPAGQLYENCKDSEQHRDCCDLGLSDCITTPLQSVKKWKDTELIWNPPSLLWGQEALCYRF